MKTGRYILQKLSWWSEDTAELKQGDLAVVVKDYVSQTDPNIKIPKGTIAYVMDNAFGDSTWAYEDSDYVTVRCFLRYSTPDVAQYIGLTIPSTYLKKASEEDMTEEGIRIPQIGERVKFIRDIPQISAYVSSSDTDEEESAVQISIPAGTIGIVDKPITDYNDKVDVFIHSQDGATEYFVECSTDDLVVVN